MKILDKKVSSNVNLFSINEWFYNILGAILYSRILRILRMSNTAHITHGSIYGIMYIYMYHVCMYILIFLFFWVGVGVGTNVLEGYLV